LRSRAIAQILTLMSGTVVAQGVMVLCAPLLTRLYTPTDFGVYALFGTVANMVAAVAAGRYELAIMLPRRERSAAHLALLTLMLSVAAAVVLLVAVVGIQAMQMRHGRSRAELAWTWFVPAAVLLYAWDAALGQWQARHHRFHNMAAAEVSTCLGIFAVQVGAGLLLARAGGTALIGGMIFGQLLAVAVQAPSALPAIWRGARPRRWTRVRLEARRHWRFPAFATFAALLSKGTFEAPKILVAWLFSPQVLGYYTLSKRVLGMPLTLVSQSISRVFYQRIAHAHQSGRRTRPMLLKSSGLLFLMILPPMAVLFVWAEPIFRLAFGEDWAAAGRYCRLLIPLYIARFVVAPTGLSMVAFEKQHMVAVWNATYLVSGALAVGAGWMRGSAEFSMLAFALVSFCMYAVYFVMSLRVAGRTTPARTVAETLGRASP